MIPLELIGAVLSPVLVSIFDVEVGEKVVTFPPIMVLTTGIEAEVTPGLVDCFVDSDIVVLDSRLFPVELELTVEEPAREPVAVDEELSDGIAVDID